MLSYQQILIIHNKKSYERKGQRGPTVLFMSNRYSFKGLFCEASFYYAVFVTKDEMRVEKAGLSTRVTGGVLGADPRPSALDLAAFNS